MASMTVAPEISHPWSLALLPSDTPLALLDADGQAVPCGELERPPTASSSNSTAGWCWAGVSIRRRRP